MKVRRITSRVPWKELVGLIAVYSAFAICLAAQVSAEKPLSASSRARLAEELKGVISRTSPNPGDAASIGQRWNTRRDLAGKSKAKVIDLFWDDVKAVVKDSGARYQIYSIFSFYKSIPDASFTSTQQPKGSASKPTAVHRLVALTYGMHPYVGIDERLAQLPGTGDIAAATEKDRQNRIAGFDDALKMNAKLTPQQKTFVRANYDRLMKISDQITARAIKTNFPTERWIKDGLTKSYAGNFTFNQLNELNAYFQGQSGRQFLKYNRNTHMAELIKGNGGTPDITDADKAEYDSFAGTPLGKKFIEAYMRDAIAYEEAKENAVRAKTPNADGFAIYEPANLNKLFNKFVAENYRK
jgi:hypothetical protein